MWYGWTGVGLEVDLSRKKIKKTEGDPQVYRDYMGGYGLISKLFWDKVPPETEPFSPDNAIIFGAGPLVGTVAPSTCRVTVVTKSALTGMMSHSNSAGFWAPELKFAGYDTLFITGKSPTPVYLYINNDKVEIRDASHLWGKGVLETQKAIREELGEDKIQSLCIGPAGENRVYFADVSHGPGCSMSRGGAGAIMGDKKLKAIAVLGGRDVNVARTAPFLELCDDIMRQSAFMTAKAAGRWPDSPKGYNYIDLMGRRDGSDLSRNFGDVKPWPTIDKDYLGFLLKQKASMVGCFNCQVPCIYTIPMPNGDTIFWKCRTRRRFVAVADIQDFEFSAECTVSIQRFGMDSLSAGNVCAFAIDLYQKGILTQEDTGGLVLDWGNPEVPLALVEKIAYRKDIGNVLADGVYRAAQQIGRGSEQYAHHMKKLELRNRNESDGGIAGSLRMLTSDRQGENGSRFRAYGYNGLLEDVKDLQERERWRNYLENPPRHDGEIDREIQSKMLAYDCECGILRDSAGICRNRFSKDENLTEFGIAYLPNLVSYATGEDYSLEEARKCTRRARALTRSYNSILGERMNVNDMEAWLLSPPLLANDRALLKELLAETNRAMGFNPEGIPLPEHLEALGLNDVAEKLERRGILPERVAIPG